MDSENKKKKISLRPRVKRAQSLPWPRAFCACPEEKEVGGKGKGGTKENTAE